MPKIGLQRIIHRTPPEPQPATLRYIDDIYQTMRREAADGIISVTGSVATAVDLTPLDCVYPVEAALAISMAADIQTSRFTDEATGKALGSLGLAEVLRREPLGDIIKTAYKLGKWVSAHGGTQELVEEESPYSPLVATYLTGLGLDRLFGLRGRTAHDQFRWSVEVPPRYRWLKGNLE